MTPRRLLLCSVLLLCAVLSIQQLSSAHAADQRQKSIWMGNAFDHINRTNNIAHWRSLNIIAHTFSTASPINETEARQALNFFRWYGETDYHKYTSGSSPSSDQLDFANHLYEAVSHFPSLTAIVSNFLKDKLNETVDAPSAQLKQWQIYNTDYYQDYATKEVNYTQVLSDIYDAANRDPTFAKVFDEVYGIPLFHAKIGDSAQQIIDNNPAFGELHDIQRLANDLTSLQDTVTDLKSTVETTLTAVQTSMQTGSNSAIPNHDTQGGQDTMQLLIAQQRQRVQEQKDKLAADGIRSSLYVLTFLMTDKTAAGQLNAVGNAILDFKAVTDRYNTLYASGENSSAMSSAMLTMNYVAIFMTLVDSMSEKGPSPDQIISTQIQELAKQMRVYQEENRLRFDRIDSELSQTFAEMTKDFNQISRKLNDMSQDLQGMRGALAAVLFRVDQVERLLTSYLEVILEEPFGRAMTGCLGYEKKTGKPLSEEGYDNCALDIVNFVELSKSAPLSGQWTQGMAGKDFATSSLLAGDWASNVNLFLGLAGERGGYSVPEKRANPLRWARAAEAFVVLSNESSDIFRKKPRVVLDSLISEGEALDVDLTTTFVNSPQQYLAMLGSLMDEYKNDVKAVSIAAARSRQRPVDAMQAVAAWLDPAELRGIAASHRFEFNQREVSTAGNGPVRETQWPAGVPADWKTAIRNSGRQLNPIMFKDYVWNVISRSGIDRSRTGWAWQLAITVLSGRR
jgi:hypothetical protein